MGAGGLASMSEVMVALESAAMPFAMDTSF
jgi:hypothetical protein